MWACNTRSVVQTSSSPQSLKNWICREEDEDRTDGGRQEVKVTRRSQWKDGAPLTDFFTVVGQPWSSTGPLSVSLILKRREKLMGRM